MASTDPLVHQFVNALPTPCPSTTQGLMPPRTFGPYCRGTTMNWLHPSNLGFAVRSKLADGWP